MGSCGSCREDSFVSESVGADEPGANLGPKVTMTPTSWALGAVRSVWMVPAVTVLCFFVPVEAVGTVGVTEVVRGRLRRTQAE